MRSYLSELSFNPPQIEFTPQFNLSQRKNKAQELNFNEDDFLGSLQKQVSSFFESILIYYQQSLLDQELPKIRIQKINQNPWTQLTKDIVTPFIPETKRFAETIHQTKHKMKLKSVKKLEPWQVFKNYLQQEKQNKKEIQIQQKGSKQRTLQTKQFKQFSSITSKFLQEENRKEIKFKYPKCQSKVINLNSKNNFKKQKSNLCINIDFDNLVKTFQQLKVCKSKSMCVSDFQEKMKMKDLLSKKTKSESINSHFNEEKNKNKPNVPSWFLKKQRLRHNDQRKKNTKQQQQPQSFNGQVKENAINQILQQTKNKIIKKKEEEEKKKKETNKRYTRRKSCRSAYFGGIDIFERIHYNIRLEKLNYDKILHPGKYKVQKDIMSIKYAIKAKANLKKIKRKLTLQQTQLLEAEAEKRRLSKEHRRKQLQIYKRQQQLFGRKNSKVFRLLKNTSNAIKKMKIKQKVKKYIHKDQKISKGELNKMRQEINQMISVELKKQNKEKQKIYFIQPRSKTSLSIRKRSKYHQFPLISYNQKPLQQNLRKTQTARQFKQAQQKISRKSRFIQSNYLNIHSKTLSSFKRKSQKNLKSIKKSRKINQLKLNFHDMYRNSLITTSSNITKQFSIETPQISRMTFDDTQWIFGLRANMIHYNQKDSRRCSSVRSSIHQKIYF